MTEQCADPSPLRIEPFAGEADLTGVLEVEAESFTNPWTRDMYAWELQNRSVCHIYVVRSQDYAVAGFCAFWLVFDEIHINNVAIRPPLRGQGIGTTLLQHVLAEGKRLGAHRAIDYKSEDFVAVIREATSGRGVDVILDMVGGDYFARNMSSLATEGRLVQIAFLKGSRVELDLNSVMRKRLLVTGSTLRPRPISEKSAIAAALKKKVWPLLEAGTVRPAIHATFPLTEAAEAHRMMEADTHIGKIVLVA